MPTVKFMIESLEKSIRTRQEEQLSDIIRKTCKEKELKFTFNSDDTYVLKGTTPDGKTINKFYFFIKYEGYGEDSEDLKKYHVSLISGIKVRINKFNTIGETEKIFKSRITLINLKIDEEGEESEESGKIGYYLQIHILECY